MFTLKYEAFSIQKDLGPQKRKKQTRGGTASKKEKEGKDEQLGIRKGLARVERERYNPQSIGHIFADNTPFWGLLRKSKE